MYLMFSYWKKRRADLVRTRLQIDPNEITFDAQTDEVRKLSSIAYQSIIIILRCTVTIGTIGHYMVHCSTAQIT